jgi:hypothetical protein
LTAAAQGNPAARKQSLPSPANEIYDAICRRGAVSVVSGFRDARC